MKATAVAAAAFMAISAPALAASPDAWAAHNMEVAKACSKVSGLAKAKTNTPADFETQSLIRVKGEIATGRMKGARVTMLCLFDKKTRKAAAVEAPPDAGW